MRRLLLITTLAAAFAAAAAPAARATFHGPDGRIAYTRFTGVSDLADLYTARPDGSGAQLVATDAWNSNWSADGRLIYNQETGAPDEELFNLFVRDPDGTTHQLTDEPFWHGSPAFSPGGSRIVFETDLGDYPAHEGLYVIDADGSHRRRLTTTPPSMVFDMDPSWSLDGTGIAFLRVRSGDGFIGRAQHWWGHHFQAAVFTVAPDGTGLRRITPWGADIGSPDWSPDGRRLVVTANWDTRPGQSSAIYTMRPDGSDLRAVFDDGPNTANGSDQPNVRGSFDPHFSPSGKRIVFGHFLGFDAGSELDTIRTDGTDLKTIGPAPFPAVLPSWGPLGG
jgi:dipeptidyl aminopeptidase/acylaminoacyl peptidase